MFEQELVVDFGPVPPKRRRRVDTVADERRYQEDRLLGRCLPGDEGRAVVQHVGQARELRQDFALEEEASKPSERVVRREVSRRLSSRHALQDTAHFHFSCWYFPSVSTERRDDMAQNGILIVVEHGWREWFWIPQAQ